MPSIYDEVRIVFRGPCERLFIAYKPLGWHVCSPSGKKKMEDSLSSVIGAKLRIPEDYIRFPSKLKINQKGLVIGATDDAMYSQISQMIANGECRKVYTGLVELNLRGFLTRRKHLNIFLDEPPGNYSELRGRVEFNLRKTDNKTQTEPTLKVDTFRGCNSHSIKFKLTSLESLLSKPESDSDLGDFPRERFSLLEVESGDKEVDKNLEGVLEGLGIKVVEGFDKKLKGSYKMLHLSSIQMMHPILRRTITSSVTSPVESWIRNALPG